MLPQVADLDLGEQGLDLGDELEHNLEISGNQDSGIDGEPLELGLGVNQDLEVGLQVYEHLNERIDVDVGLGDDVGCALTLASTSTTTSTRAPTTTETESPPPGAPVTWPDGLLSVVHGVGRLMGGMLADGTLTVGRLTGGTDGEPEPSQGHGSLRLSTGAATAEPAASTARAALKNFIVAVRVGG
ncbi:53beb85d-d095-4ee2-b180-fe3331a2c062 [Thermothielavioides terrestris]|uniref:53beb85d-d095-4ee2-b180-fe3331a2c062 n=1 Tax=Thermothielavioides terrestris TaxID=2587410 RepID=A0A3S5CX54_9PEZI|nr:53beb85d-d095-4ee2-b180-fe3331a2c062 [Thermothielavioides terrestris]